MKKVFRTMFIYIASNSSAPYLVECIDTTLLVEVNDYATKVKKEKFI